MPLMTMTQLATVVLALNCLLWPLNALEARQGNLTTLADAIESNSPEWVTQALRNVEDVNVAVTERGDTPLILSLQHPHGEFEIFELLLDAGADPDLGDNNGNTALHHAVVADDFRLLRLLEHGANVDAANARGGTPLHLAASGIGSLYSALLLLEYSANINALDEQGQTPLHHAARTGQFHLIYLLLKYGADTTVKDNEGMTPLDLARANGRERSVRILEERASDEDL